MFVIDVIPFARHTPNGSLSYRFRERLAIGTIVSVPLRKQIVHGIVVGCMSVRDAKITLKNAPFTLRAGSITTTDILPTIYRKVFIHTAKYHALPLGNILRALLPEILLSNGFSSKHLLKGDGFVRAFCEAPYQKRIDKYTSIQKKSNKTTLLIAPTNIEVSHLSKIFPDAISISGALRKKARESALVKAWDTEMVITTPQYAFTPIKHISHIIIERESAHSYHTATNIPIDMRVAIQEFASSREIPLTFGGYPLRIEVRPEPSSNIKLTSDTIIKIIDARRNKKLAIRQTFETLPLEIKKRLAKTLEQGGVSAILATRKGYASAVICRDCGASVRDKKGRALSLVTVSGKRIFRSSDNATKLDAKALCDVCGSWNLLPLGIGTERVVEAVTKEFPDANIVRFDTDVIKTSVAAQRASTQFYKSKTIIIGTEALLPWLNPNKTISFAVIASADSLLALPFWRARERLLEITLALSEHTKKIAVVTRRPDDTVFSTLQNLHDSAFLIEETSMRKKLMYPPFCNLIIVHIENTKEKLHEDEAYIDEIFSPEKSISLPDRQNTKNKLIRTLIYKYPKTLPWPNPAITEKLSKLPSWITIRINPESIW